MLIIIWFILEFIFNYVIPNATIAVWLAELMLLNMHITIENRKNILPDYPREDCIKPPAQIQFLFKKVDTRLKDSPKEMYYSTLIHSIGFIIYTVIAIFIVAFGGEAVGFIIGIGYIIISEGLDFYFVLKMDNKNFRQRYKKLTRYNLKYYLISSDNSDPTEIGTCTIVSWYEKRKRKIATVKVVETGEVIKDVLIDGSLCEDENAIYTLYEICKLYYLKQMKRNKEKKNCNKKKNNRKKK